MKFSEEQLAPFFEKTKIKADKIMLYYFIGNFLFGLFLAFFYDTWAFAFMVGGINLITYFSARLILPNTSLYQYIGSGVSALFVAQFIYQMHGMFEMHFFVFVASLVLIAYHNWKLQLPLIIIVVIHHASFAWLQYSGMKEIYFTQLEYMDLQTFIFHGGLAQVIVFLSGYWSYDFKKRAKESAMYILSQEHQITKTGEIIAFVEKLSKGDLDVTLELSETGKLENSMLMLQSNLTESRQKEEQDKVMSIGFAEINEILRSYQHNIQALCDQVIAKVVKHLNVNQGGLFIVEGEHDNDLHLLLKSHYAYNRKKYLEKRIEIGQGLIGQAYLEKDKIYMTEVPGDYVSITSGLGEATPTSIILVPLIYNDKVEGVIELASFNKLQEYEQDFLMKVGESIASTLLAVKMNEQTRTLLENTHIQTEQLQAQEEEMRQNMEELEATQEEMRRTETELQKQLQASKLDEQLLRTQLRSLKEEYRTLKEESTLSLI